MERDEAHLRTTADEIQQRWVRHVGQSGGRPTVRQVLDFARIEYGFTLSEAEAHRAFGSNIDVKAVDLDLISRRLAALLLG